jgi:hypothetical protein
LHVEVPTQDLRAIRRAILNLAEFSQAQILPAAPHDHSQNGKTAERYNRDCDHQGAHMKVVTVRDFRDHASEMFRSDDVVLVTREGTPAGFFLPWDTPELPVEVRREVFLRLSEQVGAALKAKDVDEQEVLGDFAASRSRS